MDNWHKHHEDFLKDNIWHFFSGYNRHQFFDMGDSVAAMLGVGFKEILSRQLKKFRNGLEGNQGHESPME